MPELDRYRSSPMTSATLNKPPVAPYKPASRPRSNSESAGPPLRVDRTSSRALCVSFRIRVIILGQFSTSRFGDTTPPSRGDLFDAKRPALLRLIATRWRGCPGSWPKKEGIFKFFEKNVCNF